MSSPNSVSIARCQSVKKTAIVCSEIREELIHGGCLRITKALTLTADDTPTSFAQLIANEILNFGPFNNTLISLLI